MRRALRTMIECRWSAHRIQQYIDGDPSAPLGAAEVRRLEAHLAVCDRCGAALRELRGLRSALARLGERHAPDPARIARVKLQAEQLAHGEGHR